MNFATRMYTGRISNKNVHIDGASGGLDCLHQFLTALQGRIDLHGGREDVSMEAFKMQFAISKIIELAYKDFDKFSEEYSCLLHYNNHPDTSGVFGITLTEKNDCPRTHQFRFTQVHPA